VKNLINYPQLSVRRGEKEPARIGGASKSPWTANKKWYWCVMVAYGVDYHAVNTLKITVTALKHGKI
jgi:hypothetical protein